MYRLLIENLRTWKNSSFRTPLLLRGARQVGKTYLIEAFGAQEFSGSLSVNFEASPEATACFETFDPTEILFKLERIYHHPIVPGQTLLFLDEIQACPRAIMALRYFKEKLPALHVIGAGSLLEFALKEESFSFPVGRVQFLYLQPLSFQEFALATEDPSLWNTLQQCTLASPPTEELHQKCNQMVRVYALLGGMPAVVSHYCTSRSFLECSQIQNILLSTYRADFSKYAKNQEQKYLKILFQGLPQLVCQQFKYHKIDPHLRSRELKDALAQLEAAGLIYPVYATSGAGIPLAMHLKRTQFKTLFIDVGLLQRALLIEPHLSDEWTLLHRGALAEQWVGQELLAYEAPDQERALFYWTREKQGSDAEIDYLYPIDEEIFPIEVKAGTLGKLKSLRLFIEEKHSPFGIKISNSPLHFEHGILSIPFYLISQIPRLIRSFT